MASKWDIQQTRGTYNWPIKSAKLYLFCHIHFQLAIGHWPINLDWIF